MLRYRVFPKIRDDDSVICLGCSRAELDTITHANLGRLSEQGPRLTTMLGLARETVVGIFGQRGSGKSYTLGSIVESLGATDLTANIGRNVNDRAVLVLDTLNIYQFSAVPVSQIPEQSLRRVLAGKLGAFGVRETEVSLRTFFPEGHRQGFYRPEYLPFAVDTSLMQPEDFAHIFDIDLYRDPTGHLLFAAFDGIKTTGYRVGTEDKTGDEGSGLAELVEYLSDERNTEEPLNELPYAHFVAE